jgi:polyisoprenoid-binding protein YceI
MEGLMQRMFRMWVIVTVLCSGAGARAAPSSDYLISRELSAVGFTVYKWTVLKEEGRFKDVSGRVHYDPTSPRGSSIDITVNTASLDTSNAGRDSVLRSDDFFDAQRFPTMRFVSRHVEPRPDRTLAVSGDLTLHGVTRAIDVIVRVNGVTHVDHVGDLAGFETTFHINRTAFGVNGTRWTGGKLVISTDVEIHLAIAATENALYTHSQAKQ